MRNLIFSVIICCFFIPNFAYSDELTNEKKAAIKELLQVTGAYKLGEMFGNAFTAQMIKVLKESKPDIDPRAFDIIKEESEALMHEELVEKESLLPFMYPIYHRYLTLGETKGLIQFYKTPLGRKAVSVVPKMTQEGMLAGQEWGKIIGPKLQQKVLKRLKKEGIRLNN